MGLTRTEKLNDGGQVTSVVYSEPQPTEAERQALEAKQAADRDAENQRIAQENAARAAKLESDRVTRNRSLDGIWGTRFREYDDSWSTKPGTGYHFESNFKAEDGNYYAIFRSNRGSNVRYFSISERKWISDYAMGQPQCRNCGEQMRGLAVYDKICTKCGTVFPKY